VSDRLCQRDCIKIVSERLYQTEHVRGIVSEEECQRVPIREIVSQRMCQRECGKENVRNRITEFHGQIV